MLDRDKLSPTIRLLFDKAIELDAQKIDVTYRTLRQTNRTDQHHIIFRFNRSQTS